MSLEARLRSVFAAVGAEIKAVRAVAVNKYTRPSTGIPVDDLAAAVRSSLTRADNALLRTTDSTETGRAVLSASSAQAGREALQVDQQIAAATRTAVLSTQVGSIWVGTQAEYDALQVKNPTTQYNIVSPT